MKKFESIYILGILLMCEILLFPSVHAEGLEIHNVVNCPDRVFDTDELKSLISKFRDARSDVPPAPQSEFGIRVLRVRCMYYVSEYLSDDGTKANLFAIDPYGELYFAKPIE
jgi:hypothetical protein